MLPWSNTKFSELIYKEICDSQRGELTIWSWRVTKEQVCVDTSSISRWLRNISFAKQKSNKRSAKKYKKGIKMSTMDEQEWCYTQWQIMKLQ